MAQHPSRDARPGDERIVRDLAREYYRPLSPSDEDQGDPFILDLPEEAGSDFRFYIYTSGEHARSGTAIPCFGTNDLIEVAALGDCLPDSVPRAHWAPCVRYIASLARPYVMLYSRSIALGEQAHIGHQIRRADSLRPEGPFEDNDVVVTPNEDFAIDADVTRRADGATLMAYATDFVADEPLGTGIVETEISNDLRQTMGPGRVLERARTEEQIFEEARAMPWKAIPGVDWEAGDLVRWYTVEAPVYLTAPDGRRVVLYSSGSFYKDNYAVGALVEDDAGNMVDVSATDGNFVIKSQPESGIYSLGHPSALVLDSHYFLVIHMREGSVQAPRQMTVVPLLWRDGNVPYCPTRAEVRRAAP